MRTGKMDGRPTFAYQWLRNGVTDHKRTATPYTLAAEDEGKAVQCQVTATNAAGSSAAASSAKTAARGGRGRTDAPGLRAP